MNVLQRAVNAERELQSLEEKMRDSDTNKVLSSGSDDQFSQDDAAQLLAQKVQNLYFEYFKQSANKMHRT